MSEYKDLPLNRDELDNLVTTFIDNSGLSIDGVITETQTGKRVKFGQAGTDFATVDLLLNNTGLTTVHWKLGKNQALGEELAKHLKETIDPAEFETVNLSIKGIVSESIDPIIALIDESEDFSVETLHDDHSKIQVTITSVKHQDHITITHHRNTLILQIQGKPLSSYRKTIYLVSDLLDLKSLEQVLCRKDDGASEIVRKEVAEDYVKGFFPDSYEDLPQSVRKLLISGCCVKLASPKLPDYSMLLYPDLRSLEGVLKEQMAGYSMYPADEDNGFGEYFTTEKGAKVLKEAYANNVGHDGMTQAFNNAYTMLSKYRNAIFHMEEYPDGSTMIDSLDRAISISKDTYKAIHDLYDARK